MTENLGLPQGDPRQFATPDMMLGKGLFTDLQSQARLHVAILQQSQKLAWEAFHAVADMGLLTPSYTAIRQESKESFMNFLEMLLIGSQGCPQKLKVHWECNCLWRMLTLHVKEFYRLCRKQPPWWT